MSLHNQVLIVTGAGGNLGAATAHLLAAAGAQVVLADAREEALQRTLAALPQPDRHLGIGGLDLGSEADCAALAAQTLARFGRIDGLATTVGGFAGAPIAATDAKLLLEMIQLNSVTTLNVIHAVLPIMRARRSGSIVAVGAASAVHAGAGIAAYAAAKSVVFRLVESFAEELRPEGVRVNAVLPGTLDTPQNRAAMPDADPSGWVAPRQIAAVIGFLLSDAAAAVTGALLPVTGCTPAA